MAKKNGWGGRRPNSGRKPKAKEMELIEKLDKLIDPEDAIISLNKLISKLDIAAIRLYLEYRFGKPKNKVDVTTQGERIHNFNLSNLTDEQLEIVLKLYDTGEHTDTD